MVILEDEKVVFVHIPKCGGTSVSACLDGVARWNDIFVGGTELGEYLNRSWAVRFHLRKHSTPAELRASLGNSNYEGYKKFILVRNPIDRFLSAYNFMLRHIDLGTEWIMPGVRAFGLANVRGFDEFIFSDFVADAANNYDRWSLADFQNLEQARVWDIVRLFLPQTAFFDPSEAASGRFQIFKLERGAEFDDFLRSMGITRGAQLLMHNTNDIKKVVFDMLSDDALNRLCRLYSMDFINFDYTFPSGHKANY